MKNVKNNVDQNHTVKLNDISLMSEDELSAELEKSFMQISEGKTKSVEESFEDIYVKHSERQCFTS